MDAGKRAAAAGFLQFLVDKVIGEVYRVGVFLGVAEEYPAHSGPVEGRQTHGARLARAVDGTSRKREVRQGSASAPYRVDLRMGGRVVVYRDGISAGGYYVSVAVSDYGTEGASSAVDILFRDFGCHFHEPLVLFGDGVRIFFHGFNGVRLVLLLTRDILAAFAEGEYKGKDNFASKIVYMHKISKSRQNGHKLYALVRSYPSLERSARFLAAAVLGRLVEISIMRGQLR